MPLERKPLKRVSRGMDSSPEEHLVRIIHRKVGGPSALSTYDDPARVRAVVIAALASEQPAPSEARRVEMGDLTALERRVVRTVTNRGAAVRSRMRQRRELSRLREELRKKDVKLRMLEEALANVTNTSKRDCETCAIITDSDSFSAGESKSTKNSHPHHHRRPCHRQQEISNEFSPHNTNAYQSMQCIVASQQHQGQPRALSIDSSHSTQDTEDARVPTQDASVDRDLFGSLIDQMIAPLS